MCHSFRVLDWLDVFAYKIAMLTPLLLVLDVFDISMIRKYVFDPTHVLSYEGLKLSHDLTYGEKPVQIMDRKDKVLRNKTIPWLRCYGNIASLRKPRGSLNRI